MTRLNASSHYLKSIQIRSFFWPYFPVFRPNTEKYGLEKTPLLDTLHVVMQVETTQQNLWNSYCNTYNFAPFLSLEMKAVLSTERFLVAVVRNA